MGLLKAVPPKSIPQVQAAKLGLPGLGTGVKIQPKGQVLALPPSPGWATHGPASPHLPCPITTFLPLRYAFCHYPRIPALA